MVMQFGVETGGFQVLSLRHYRPAQCSLPAGVSPKKPNNGGPFGNDLLTGLGEARACRLSLGPFLSKAVDCRI